MKCRIDRQAADIICLTETNTNRLTLPEHGHSICAGDDWGQQRRKGQEGWRNVEIVGNTSLPSGRFVSGVTQTSAGEITVIGVCMSYSRAHGDKPAAAHAHDLQVDDISLLVHRHVSD